MFVCGVPADAAAFSRVLTVEQTLFGKLSLPAPVAEEFFRVSPEIFAVVSDPDGAVAAYSTAFPLQERWAQALIAGDVVEPELTPDMLLDRRASHEGAHVYIGSVVVDSQRDALTRSSLLASLLSWRIRQLREFTIKRVSVMMMGVSKQGQQLIRYTGAKKLNDGANRRDGYSIYGRAVSQSFLYRATTTIERCFNGGLIRMDMGSNWSSDRAYSICPDIRQAAPLPEAVL